MSTKENEGRKRIYSDNPLEDMNIFDRMIFASNMLNEVFEGIPLECSMSVMVEWMHTRCHQTGLYFPDFLDSIKATAEMIEHDSEFWYLESEVK